MSGLQHDAPSLLRLSQSVGTIGADLGSICRPPKGHYSNKQMPSSAKSRTAKAKYGSRCPAERGTKGMVKLATTPARSILAIGRSEHSLRITLCAP